jgi:hypothetical protein
VRTELVPAGIPETVFVTIGDGNKRICQRFFLLTSKGNDMTNQNNQGQQNQQGNKPGQGGQQGQDKPGQQTQKPGQGGQQGGQGQNKP